MHIGRRNVWLIISWAEPAEDIGPERSGQLKTVHDPELCAGAGVAFMACLGWLTAPLSAGRRGFGSMFNISEWLQRRLST